ncbi:MAG: Tetraspanin/Peripherin [Benjaminiella poitrasii]|nr:MAG: Tetraspanin/Peripherin [Benjaminiella poitrasii]
MDGRFMYKRSQRLREYVASFHLFTMIIGLVVISIGAYIINSSTFSKTICIGLFVFGGVITLTSFDGFFGAYLEDTTLLMLYNIATTLYFVTEVVVIRLAYVYQTQLNHSTSKIWDFFVEQDSQFIYNIEESLSCCGYDSIDDRAIPSNKTCSVLLNTTIGCKESVLTLAHEWQKWIIVCLVTILVFQLI